MTAATGVLIPYITPYSEERVSLDLAFAPHAESTDGLRLTYRDPDPDDWMFGVLWARQENHRRGRPEFDQVHTQRQRECMLGLLCQVCKGSAVDETGRVSWVFPERVRTTSPRLSKAPACLTCIPKAIAACAHLRRNARTYTSAEPAPWGVVGNILTRQANKAIAIQPSREIPLDAFRQLDSALARALIVQVWDLKPLRLP
jgi:hypothetical protein